MHYQFPSCVTTSYSKGNKEKRGKGRKRVSGSQNGTHHCPQPEVWQNISALQALWNCIRFPRDMDVIWKEFHQDRARAQEALALVKANQCLLVWEPPLSCLQQSIMLFRGIYQRRHRFHTAQDNKELDPVFFWELMKQTKHRLTLCCL